MNRTSERETVVDLPWAACGLLFVRREAANRVTINCWYQRRCSAVGVYLRNAGWGWGSTA
jgi:hypothetical protein